MITTFPQVFHSMLTQKFEINQSSADEKDHERFFSRKFFSLRWSCNIVQKINNNIVYMKWNHCAEIIGNPLDLLRAPIIFCPVPTSVGFSILSRPLRRFFFLTFLEFKSEEKKYYTHAGHEFWSHKIVE